MTEVNHENVLIQLREALNRNGIKLWEEPYCIGGESNESEIVVRNFCRRELEIPLFTYFFFASESR